MNDNRPLTTGDVAAYCHVTVAGVTKWVKASRLRAYSTPGGHYRIFKEDFLEFLVENSMPVDERFFGQEKRKVLVVDDEEAVVDIVMEAAREVLPEYELLSAANGYDAGVLVTKHKPDLVVLDLRMPGINGFEVCQRIRGDDSTARTRILVMTAYYTRENIARAKQCGADAFIAKPFEIGELQREMLTLLGREAPVSGE
jgi:excisionase family DNA binding protein